MWTVVFLIGGMGVIAVLLLSRKTKPVAALDEPSPSAASHARIRGNGKYSVDVVGESHYRRSFEALLGANLDTEKEMFGDATLHLESDNKHDHNAVRVDVEGRTVGYLRREMAIDFRRAVRESGIGGRTVYACGVRIYCGGADGVYSAQLDLPED